ncbi:predicted protein [Naegleria gruberi]|uniref:Predicted protein n=1 Tax=Naegleria gruberi TaxID=5762 RepID=D2VNH9_NAEGR|nr:uncharacterized protein NAEGRDRAFT_51003 [Naegleria gruberi]EFC41736.1 predicted protein [Naegleria gruberi]|eukprot:XP_002674480.1 predicted protein [Naegleria gruberi strain NEG-M]
MSHLSASGEELKRKRQDDDDDDSENNESSMDHEEMNKCLGKICCSVHFPKNSLPIEVRLENKHKENQQQTTPYNLFYRQVLSASKFVNLPNNMSNERFLLLAFLIQQHSAVTGGVAIFDLWKKEFIGESEYVMDNAMWESSEINLIVFENSPYFLCYSLECIKLMKIHENGKITFVKDLERLMGLELKESDLLVFHTSVFKLKYLSKEVLESRSSISCFEVYEESLKEMGATLTPSTHSSQLLKYNAEEGSGSVVSYGGSSYRSYTSSKIIRFDFNTYGSGQTRDFESIYDAEAGRNATALIAGRYLISFGGYYKDREDLVQIEENSSREELENIRNHLVDTLTEQMIANHVPPPEYQHQELNVELIHRLDESVKYEIIEFIPTYSKWKKIAKMDKKLEQLGMSKIKKRKKEERIDSPITTIHKMRLVSKHFNRRMMLKLLKMSEFMINSTVDPCIKYYFTLFREQRKFVENGCKLDTDALLLYQDIEILKPKPPVFSSIFGNFSFKSASGEESNTVKRSNTSTFSYFKPTTINYAERIEEISPDFIGSNTTVKELMIFDLKHHSFLSNLKELKKLILVKNPHFQYIIYLVNQYQNGRLYEPLSIVDDSMILYGWNPENQLQELSAMTFSPNLSVKVIWKCVNLLENFKGLVLSQNHRIDDIILMLMMTQPQQLIEKLAEFIQDGDVSVPLIVRVYNENLLNFLSQYPDAVKKYFKNNERNDNILHIIASKRGNNLSKIHLFPLLSLLKALPEMAHEVNIDGNTPLDLLYDDSNELHKTIIDDTFPNSKPRNNC